MYTYPKAVAIGGGKTEMMQAISKVTEDLKNAGMSFRSVSLGPAGKFYTAGKETHCVIPQTMFMNIESGIIKLKSIKAQLNGRVSFFGNL